MDEGPSGFEIEEIENSRDDAYSRAPGLEPRKWGALEKEHEEAEG